MFRVDVTPTQFFSSVGRFSVFIRLVGGQRCLLGSNVQVESEVAAACCCLARSKAPAVNSAGGDGQQFPVWYENDFSLDHFCCFIDGRPNLEKHSLVCQWKESDAEALVLGVFFENFPGIIGVWGLREAGFCRQKRSQVFVGLYCGLKLIDVL